MKVIVKSKRQISEFYKRSDSRFNSPRFKNGKDVLTAWFNKFNVLQTGLSTEDAERLGALIGKDLSPISPFWNDYSVTIMDKDLILHTENPEDELKYLVLKAHYRVANGPDDANPIADYVIYDEVKEAVKTNEIASVKIKAYTLYSKLTMSQKREILKLYPGYMRTDNVEDALIESNLVKVMESDFSKFITIVEDKELNSKIFLKDLVTARILTKNKNMYKYGDDVIGHSEESTIEHLNDPKNQGLKIALIKELEGIKK